MKYFLPLFSPFLFAAAARHNRNFTPDGNGRNDVFKALNTGNVSTWQLKIFNRWGALIFSSNDTSAGWDGTYKGIKQPPGVYVYMIQYNEMNNPEMKLLKGSLMLIR